MKLITRLRHSPGTLVPHHKETANSPTEVMPVPEKIILPMNQHVGAPCQPCVKNGDMVYVGTMVGQAPSAMSMHIYSSVSGKVTSVEQILYHAGDSETVVVIQPDGSQTPDPSICPPEVHDFQSFVGALEHSGIVGLGGAGFPTDIKVQPKNLDEIDTLLINGAECEPYLTTDNRELIECSDTVISGINACLTFLGIPKAKLCIEDNKPEAIRLMKHLCQHDSRISVCVLESRYPQGAQNVLIRNATGRTVPRGARHTSVGVMMLNVTTVSSIGKFLNTGMPLTQKRLTVAGDAILHPKNLEVPIGTPIEDILNYCGLREEPHKIIVGGPMMGSAQMDVHYPITRQNNGLLAFGARASEPVRSSACIRCGRCVNACPMGLSPLDIRAAYYALDTERLDSLMADLCIGCGTCSYVCPAKRPLTQSVTLAKSYLKRNKRREKM